jgi:hypothetical protein
VDLQLSSTEVGNLESTTARRPALSTSSGAIVDISLSEATANDTDSGSRVVADVYPSENREADRIAEADE